jgi:antitoxin ParD1/3/4
LPSYSFTSYLDCEWIEETRQKVAVGIAQLDRGESRDADIVIEGILDRFREAKEIVK